jgi:hypothetical protein
MTQTNDSNMQFSDSKLVQHCKFCGKNFIHLAAHIIKSHPSVVAQLEEKEIVDNPAVVDNPTIASYSPLSTPAGIPSLSQIIRQKVDDMLSIEVIKALSNNNPGALKELAAVMNPPRETSLDEIRKYHDLFYSARETSGGTDWGSVAVNALPMIKDMLDGKRKNAEMMRNVREGNKRTEGLLKPIQLETPGGSGKPTSNSPEPGVIGETKQ